MPANKELIGKVLQSIFDHPDEHDQEAWIRTEDVLGEGDFTFDLSDFEKDCGTSCCIAGWAVLHEGFKFHISSEWDEQELETDTEVVAVKGSKSLRQSEIPNFASDSLAGEDPDLRTRVHDVFFAMDNDLAIAELMCLYETGNLPSFTKISFTRKQFVSEWLGKFYEAFEPKEAE